MTAEELGGARTHNAISGVAHYMAEDEGSCIRQIKELLGYLPQNNMENPPEMDLCDDWNRMTDSLNELIPENPGKPYDMKAVIEALSLIHIFVCNVAVGVNNAFLVILDRWAARLSVRAGNHGQRPGLVVEPFL